jgi:energy-coupling factor transporter transmembrane protein EcfT
MEMRTIICTIDTLKNKKNNRKPIVFLIIAWLIVLISFYLEAIWGSLLFSRSGSLMVLFAFIAEYYLLRTRDKYHGNQLKTFSRGNQVNFEEVHPSKSHQYLEKVSHITVIIGTVIWGYGDLLFQ